MPRSPVGADLSGAFASLLQLHGLHFAYAD